MRFVTAVDVQKCVSILSTLIVLIMLYRPISIMKLLVVAMAFVVGFGAAVVPELQDQYPDECINLKCTKEFKPFCGNNGKTFANRCQLNNKACQEKLKLKVAYEGNVELL